MIWLWSLIGSVLMALLVLGLWRLFDVRAEQRARQALISLGSIGPAVYDPAMVDGLPEPAQRFFNFTIEPGTPLHPVVEIEMEGELSLGTRERPNYRPMRARQLLAAPHGFIWSLRWNGVRGSDGALPDRSWTRFWLFGLLPVVRASGLDHQRSSFGRLIADSTFWAPASVLPGKYVSWEALGPDSARAIARYGDFEQAIDLHVDQTGQPERIVFQRWSNANPERRHRLQAFGGDFSDFESFEGYRLPTTVVAGNHYGSDDYFPFFKAKVTRVRFPR
jgi:hypothetical protein